MWTKRNLKYWYKNHWAQRLIVSSIILLPLSNLRTDVVSRKFCNWYLDENMLCQHHLASVSIPQAPINACVELEDYFKHPVVPQIHCSNPIAWWGVSEQSFFLHIKWHVSSKLDIKFPVLHLMAWDYLGIPASSCLAEWSFSMSARTNEAQHCQMGAETFGGLQRLKSAYQDGQLKAESEAWLAFDSDVYLSSE